MAAKQETMFTMAFQHFLSVKTYKHVDIFDQMSGQIPTMLFTTESAKRK